MHRALLGACAASCAIAAAPALGDVIEIRIRVENLAPPSGTWLTPVWVGIHDGTFDTYDFGASASVALERIAEDGNVGPLSSAFTMAGAGVRQTVLAADQGIPPIAPGGTATGILRIDTSLASSRYLSFASMVIPSNDAFIGNGNPMMFKLVDDNGNFTPVDAMVAGTMVRDAGTEVNDELPENTAFFGQSVADAGVPEGGVVAAHPGFLPMGSGGILDDPMFAGADFTQPGYLVARVTVERVTTVRVRVQNLAPAAGTGVTPVWIGFHDGAFDTYDAGAPASMELERLAEDGDTAPLSSLFAATSDGLDATLVADVGIPVLLPSGTATGLFVLANADAGSRYFSYASMIVPSNDAFIANGNPMAHAVFDEDGDFVGADFMVPGTAVNDAGTEVNDEVPENTAFFGQSQPNTGIPEDGVVTAHPGFLPSGSGGILDAPMFANADFLAPRYTTARFRVTAAAAGDLNGDGAVDGVDLGLLLAAWGPTGDHPADLNADGTVDGADLALLTSAWGT